MNKHKLLHFIAILLFAFALSPAVVPVCPAQLGGTSGSDVPDSGSDEIDTDAESGGSGTDTVDGGSNEEETGSGEGDTHSAPIATGLGNIGLMIFQAAGPNAAPPDTEQSIQNFGRCVSRCFRGARNNVNSSRPAPLGIVARSIGTTAVSIHNHPPATPFNVFLNTRGAQFTHARKRPYPGAPRAWHSFSTIPPMATSSPPSAPYGYSLRWAVTSLTLCFSSPARRRYASIGEGLWCGFHRC